MFTRFYALLRAFTRFYALLRAFISVKQFSKFTRFYAIEQVSVYSLLRSGLNRQFNCVWSHANRRQWQSWSSKERRLIKLCSSVSIRYRLSPRLHLLRSQLQIIFLGQGFRRYFWKTRNLLKKHNCVMHLRTRRYHKSRSALLCLSFFCVTLLREALVYFYSVYSLRAFRVTQFLSSGLHSFKFWSIKLKVPWPGCQSFERAILYVRKSRN